MCFNFSTHSPYKNSHKEGDCLDCHEFLKKNAKKYKLKKNLKKTLPKKKFKQKKTLKIRNLITKKMMSESIHN